MSNEISYLVFTTNEDPRVAHIRDISGNVPDDSKLARGVSLKGLITESTTFSLSEEGGDMLCDFVDNISAELIISSKAREVLEAEGVAGNVVEYLPFTLNDKRGRPTKGRFYVANLLLTVPCMDRENSAFNVSSVDGRVLRVKKLKVLKEKIPPDAKLFRLGEWPRVIVIRSDLVQRLKDEKLTGLAVCEQGERFTW
ncbi:hypothetical protein JQX13_41335 [Archangium violaceum]|uniref:imm11 family protein n=1 Tax=Archangium violaceum TaxID=83451 RepID=UPI00193C32B7|nr:DUF1629 domain-containing protein [Archangium violaceum]QRK06481.1 hypothetical protein JQX13_41335 [Archangium violaceum]